MEKTHPDLLNTHVTNVLKSDRHNEHLFQGDPNSRQSQEIFLGVGGFLIQALNNEFIQLIGEAWGERKRPAHWRNKNQLSMSRGPSKSKQIFILLIKYIF